VRTARLSIFALAAIAVTNVAPAAGPAILTAPLELVSGELAVEVDLGEATGRATLYLDGVDACSPTVDAPTCRVDLGPDLHVHLLELVVTTADGSVEREERWLNRPGSEADLEIELASRPIGNVCGGRLSWSDVHGGRPVDLEADAAGERLAVSPETRTFGYPCAEVGSTEIVTAEVVFGDGRRVAAAALTADSGRSAGSTPQAIILETASPGADSCTAAIDAVAGAVPGAEPQGFEVAFVLDPTINTAALAGLHGGGPTSGWDLATRALSDADRLWYVRPDRSLERVDGFAAGRDIWLGGFFQIAASPPPAELRLADAVATAGLVAGAAPRRRAVVLVLGSGRTADASRFSIEQVRSYLAEVGVPLQVIRTAPVRNDGWPPGREASTLDGFADALEGVRGRIDAQCIGWFPALLEQRQVAALIPRGVTIAGRGDSGSGGGEPVWRRAAVTAPASGNQPISGEPVGGEQVEVTAVEVLVRAQDGKGNPITDLGAGDVQVVEDGRSVPVLQLEAINSLAERVEAPPAAPAAEPLAPPPARKIVPVSIYVERRLSGAADIQPALNALKDQADWLTSLGPVDIVVAGKDIEPVLVDATDPEVVRAALDEVAALPSHGHTIEKIRKEYLRFIRVYPDRGQVSQTDASEPPTSGSPSSSTPDNSLRARTMTIARTAVFEEDALLRSTMERMNDWALGLQSSGPRLLFLVGTGFDEDPIDFYLRFLEQKDPSLGTAARAEFVRYNQAARVGSVGRELAAAGWMVVPIATRIAGQQRSAAEFSGGETFQSFLGVGDSNSIRDVEFMLLDPLGSQQHLAEPSGGKVVVGGGGLKKLISESAGWYRLTYQVARAPDGVLHDVAITSDRSEVTIESTGVVVSGTSEGRAAMRLRKLLDDPSAAGELAVRVDVGPEHTTDGNLVEASLIASVDLTPIAPLFAAEGARALRFSVGVRSGPGEPFVSHSVVTAAGAVGGMQFEAPIQWSGDDAELAVVVEDLGSGAWGGTVSRLRN
jgi:hypothetical protein